MVGAAVGLAPDIGSGKTEINQPMAGKRERRIVERLQQSAGDHVRLAVPAAEDLERLDAALDGYR